MNVFQATDPSGSVAAESQELYHSTAEKQLLSLCFRKKLGSTRFMGRFIAPPGQRKSLTL